MDIGLDYHYLVDVSIPKTLGVQTQLTTISLRKTLAYFGHIARKDSSNIEKLMLTEKIAGKRQCGGSPRRWTNQVRESLSGCLLNNHYSRQYSVSLPSARERHNIQLRAAASILLGKFTSVK
ncbi:jg27065 [Pararge aegeria aegeria]|uniref:Jg27065 protein n=1 Tax=Pararge aegeria aegeria TaxID=348720 RepID=A0A8S4S8D5_9NEOP|nr:jg27065 [Pararge aegeria aegeria]